MSIINSLRLYKLSNKLYKKKFKRLAEIIMKINNKIHNSYIPYTAEIGEGTTFAYGAIGIVIHRNTKIGVNCMIGQGTTIGGRGNHGGPPEIGNNVYISAGARVLGGFKVGDNAIIGANSVVIEEVPPNAIVVGVPAQIIKYINDSTGRI